MKTYLHILKDFDRAIVMKNESLISVYKKLNKESRNLLEETELTFDDDIDESENETEDKHEMFGFLKKYMKENKVKPGLC